MLNKLRDRLSAFTTEFTARRHVILHAAPTTTVPSALTHSTPRITRTQTPTKGESMARLTHDTIRRIIEEIDADPLAGMGKYSKKDLLVDRLYAHFNTVEPRSAEQPTTPRPLMHEPLKLEPKHELPPIQPPSPPPPPPQKSRLEVAAGARQTLRVSGGAPLDDEIPF